ncbi:MAG: class I SAM-dependent methyltransferase [Gammaproteobacteria bacterium]|nr:class I SAM-dependent methyltransferase [Gammaproteobacteria bacterium]
MEYLYLSAVEKKPVKPSSEQQTGHAAEIDSAERFQFGRNWLAFLQSVNEEKIAESISALQRMLNVTNLNGQSFLDIGSGSGLASLSAQRLGACVHSFDYDPESVACTREMARRFSAQGWAWSIEEGSVLDGGYMERLGTFDVVYSWGVLHHTGSMWSAIEQAMQCVKPGGVLFIALYNDEGLISTYWKTVKRFYNRHPGARGPLRAIYSPYFVGFGRLINQLRYLSGSRTRRGMTLWYDMVDWLGGYPFEVATPRSVEDFASARHFERINHYYVGSGLGCNEYVFRKSG